MNGERTQLITDQTKIYEEYVKQFSGTSVLSTSDVQTEKMVKHTIRVQEEKMYDPLFDEDMDLNGEITAGELERVMKRLKNGKSPGRDLVHI